MTALSEDTESGFDALLRAIGSSPSGQLLFGAAPPSALVAGTDLTISVPDQWFAVGGAVQLLVSAPDVVYDISTDKRIDVYLVAGKSTDSQTRNFTSIDPATGAVIQQTLSTTVALNDMPRVAYAVSSDPAAAPAPPVLSTTDAGAVLLATIVVLSGVPSVTVNEQARYTIPPGSPGGVGVHAQTHLPGGSDPLPVAASGQPGILDASGYDMLTGAVQSVTPASDSAYIKAVDSSGDVSLSMALHDSLAVVDSGGSPALAVKSRSKSILNGFEDGAARPDHRHTALDGGILVQTTEVDVSSSLGSVVSVPFAPQTLGTQSISAAQVISVSVYWVPPNAIDPAFAIETGWVSTASGYKGARGYITGAQSFAVELGDAGVTELTGPASALVSSSTSPQYGGSLSPVTGTLRVVATALAHASV